MIFTDPPPFDPCIRCQQEPAEHGEHCPGCAEIAQAQSDSTMRTFSL